MLGLTRRQAEVMNILWEAQKPMIASEIVKAKEDLNINTVQAALRSLIKKEYIEVAEIVYSGTVLTRSYRPLVEREEFADDVEQGIKNMLRKETLFAHYIDEIDDSDILQKLEEVIDKRKRELEEE
ncbi:BlaI/MecI/CopY family transcriptional regulator [Sellimonas sp.]|uniref:BlaI/MecI/CopY family transcriptional regulator n=1 Tax=Sellimonas sp. TaxID=2021466 RepID=UPI000B3848C3|nr:BlaI/MecI/CopY family transcriptional regulator [Sellimonas sp.]OUP01072.1 hypothetical protein B5F37_09100 [Drancourtella sp. An210]OUP66514.1 hypothetical protein B5F13_03490 [Drancourtella sp. An177]